MNNNIELAYNAKYGGFIIPQELYEYLGLSKENRDCEMSNIDNWRIRENKNLVELIKLLKQSESSVYRLLTKVCVFEHKREMDYAVSHIRSMDVVSIPKKAYYNGAIEYVEYDGAETIRVDQQKLLLISTRKSLEEYLETETILEKRLELMKIIDTLPSSFEMPHLAW